MDRFCQFLLLTNPRIGYLFLGAVEAFWGIWFLNPLLQNYLSVQSLHFDPPTAMGVIAFALGAATLIAAIKRVQWGHRFFGVVHIVFWSYVTISVGFESWASSGMPLYLSLVAASMFFYIVQRMGEPV